jgi:hypothetical protein
MRRFRVISCFASSTQQINSLRAKGVMSRQAASAAEFPISASRRSIGSWCTTPPGTLFLVTEGIGAQAAFGGQAIRSPRVTLDAAVHRGAAVEGGRRSRIELAGQRSRQVTCSSS